MSARKRVLRLLVAAFLLYVIYLGVVFGLQRKALYPGAGHNFQPPAPPAWAERWTHEFEGGQTHAYFGAAKQPDSPGAVLLHGNLQCAEHLFLLAERYRERGFAVLIPEYRGFAGATGEPTQTDIAADTARLVARFAAQPSVDADRIVYHGLSLGGGVAGAVATERAPRALILQSTFTSVRDIAIKFFAPGFLALDPYDTKRLLETTDVPALLLHGEDDDVVPVEHAHDNAAAARDGRLVLFPGRHGLPLPESKERYWKTIDDFLAERVLKE